MSWKRGLTRIYTVLWVVWGLGWGAYAGNEVLGVWDEAKHRSVQVSDGTAHRFPSKATDHEISEALGGVARRDETAELKWESDRDWTARLLREKEQGPPPATWKPLARDERANAPWRYTLYVLGLWLGLCGLAPGALLVTVRWVWAGFEQSPQA